MSEDLYNIVFKGELVRSFELVTVKKNIGQLFKVGGPKLEALFSGKTILLKRNLNFETATKYRVAIKKAGARVDVVPVTGTLSDEVDNAPAPEKSLEPAYRGKAVFGEQSESDSISQPTESSPTRTETAEEKPPLPTMEVEESGSEDDEDLSLAPPGSDVLREEERAKTEVASVDTSGLTVRDNEGELLDEHEKPQVEAPELDLSDLEVEPQEGDLLKEEERKRVPPREVDTSGLSLAEPGARLGKPSGPAPEPPDVSNISLES